MRHTHEYISRFVLIAAASGLLLLSGACVHTSSLKARAQVPTTNYAALGGTGEPTPIPLESPAPSPNGRFIAFASAAGATQSLDIWVTDRNGSNARILTPWNSVERTPDWSSDGLRIAFASNRNADDFNIWTIYSDGTGAVQLTTSPGFHGQPRFSPDGSAIAYVAPDDSGTQQLWLMDPTGNNPHPITNTLFQISDPSWAPDSQRLVFVGCSGVCNLFTITRYGTGFSQLTAGAFEDWDPNWGPAGIVFSSNRNQMLGLWTVQPNGSSLTQITAPVSIGQFEPRWDQTNNSVFFVQTDSSTTNVWVRNPDGTQNAVTNIGVLDVTPPVTTASLTGPTGNNGWYKGNVTASLTATDPDNPVVTTYYMLDGSANVTYTAPFTISGDSVHQLSFFSVDPAGNQETVKLLPVKIDSTPPVISGMPAAGCTLWPPNQKFVQVATVTAADALSGLDAASFKVVGASNEPIPPTDPKYPDIVVTPNTAGGFTIQLRADRLGNANDRIYTLTATANDFAGNTASVTSTCTVPHDQGKK